ncbi:hypothetical protein Fcan01_21200 [Folsomia candida]|uniref:Uncharacterized protein n=1 Tax=Folsomia candida TaxID=158441 RepID=A0A226DFF7_FOLCA|nr:hypothetical protein Fcan01_21200 [Folsomia candida]
MKRIKTHHDEKPLPSSSFIKQRFYHKKNKNHFYVKVFYGPLLWGREMMRCGSVGLIILAAACFVIATVAVAVPYWGQFRNRVVQETGHFGPWTICKDIDYGRKMCGNRIVMFKPGFQVYAAGVCAAVGVTALGAYGLFSIFYMTLMCSPHSSLRRYKINILITKLILSLVAVLTTWSATGLFATQGDVLEHGYIITVGFSFYMEIVVAVFSTILMLLTIGEYVSARREPDDVVDTTSEAIRMKNVITNPALTYSRGGGGGEEDPENRGRRHPGSNGSISVSRTSGLPPYVHPLTLKFKYNSTPSNNNIYVQRGSRRGQKKSPSSSRRRSSSRKTPPKPFGKDLPSPSWNGSANSITTSPPSRR